MARPLSEYFSEVECSDAFDYGGGHVRDFLGYPYALNSFDWVITNPPFRLAEQFALRALSVSREGVAILVRTVFIESIGRYNNLFREMPPSIFAQFTERVPMVKGRLDRSASTATGYAWLVWRKPFAHDDPKLAWIPPCRKQLERDGDYTPAKPRSDYSKQGPRSAAR